MNGKQVHDGANPMKFSQTFQLVPDDTNPGQYYVSVPLSSFAFDYLHAR